MKTFRIALPVRTLILSSALLAMVAVTPVSATITWGTNNVTSPGFFIQWGTTNVEAITTLEWLTSSTTSLTNTFALGAGCSTSGDVEYWGNAWAPPDPQSGGIVLVGAGTTGTWTHDSDGHAIISSSSTGCSNSAGVSVATKYKFFMGTVANKFKMQRNFTFTSPFTPNFRPYVARLFPRSSFTQVWYPTTAFGNPLAMELAANCEFGGVPGGSPSCNKTNWVTSGSLSWFAIHDPTSNRGVVVIHDSSVGDAGKQLWVDQNGGSFTASSSVLLLAPLGGFTGTVTEEETFCFYNSATASSFVAGLTVGLTPPTLPPGC